MYAHLVAHSDWGSAAGKRMMALARWQGDRYYLLPPQVVREPGALIPDLCETTPAGAAVFLGFDFPIGLPLAYAQNAGIADFLSALPRFGRDEWLHFYEPAAEPDQVSLRRPFYPARPGHARQQHLLEGLGVASIGDLRRACDHGRTASPGAPARRPASPMFWTMGGQQVGKAAISGWREVIVPALGSGLDVSIWPFSGRLADLLPAPPPEHPGPHIVIAETYPTEFYTHLGVTFPRRRGARSGKRVQAGRQANASRLLAWAERTGSALDPALRLLIADGFGPASNSDDAFDAVIGLMGMLNILLGFHSPGEPQDAAARRIEGKILGDER